MADDDGVPAVPAPPQVESIPARSIPFAASSNIADITYDENTQTLTVSFLSSGTYEYYGVPLSVAMGFADAPSAGKYLGAAIKGRYDYQKIA
jgi:KTSC domain-containing protein